MILADRGELDAVPIPVFPARAFFHGYLFVRVDSRMRGIGDMAGCRVGLRDFGSTGAIWFRGFLADRGLAWRDMRWVTGPSARFAPPADARIEAASGDLEAMLLAGEIDVFFSARVQDAQPPAGQRQLRPLLDDAPGDEAAYFREHAIHPIIHTVVVSRPALALRPDGARAVFDAYCGAKRRALRLPAGTLALPWLDARRAEVSERFAGDPLPYGLTDGNCKTIATFGRCLVEQGLIRREPDVGRLFHWESGKWQEGG
jgi:4,5-dihydroxyphthalate decarboxylase